MTDRCRDCGQDIVRRFVGDVPVLRHAVSGVDHAPMPVPVSRSRLDAPAPLGAAGDPNPPARRGGPTRFELPAVPGVESFWDFVDRSGGPDACWPWLRVRDRKGYGTVTVRGCSRAPARVTRLVLGLLRDRPLGNGELALHHCDNPPCVNPAHLYVGTVSQNALDMYARGRAPAKQRPWTHCSKGHELTDDNVLVSTHRGRPQRICRMCRNDRQRAARARMHTALESSLLPGEGSAT